MKGSLDLKAHVTIAILVVALVIFSGYAALFIAPDEATMHEVQRIFYFHVASWTGMFTAFSAALIGNVLFLRTRKPKWDWLGVSGAEVGVACCTIGLVTGPLWAKPVWGIWWTWDARLTTTFLLWLLYISYLLLRGLIEDPGRRATLSAVFGIFAFLDVPLVYLSNRLWRTQHPQPVIFGGQNSGLDPTMARVLMISVTAIVAITILLIAQRYRLERLRHRVDELRLEVEERANESESPVTPIATATDYSKGTV
jgi:heme exporter protein C